MKKSVLLYLVILSVLSCNNNDPTLKISVIEQSKIKDAVNSNLTDYYNIYQNDINKTNISGNIKVGYKSELFSEVTVQSVPFENTDKFKLFDSIISICQTEIIRVDSLINIGAITTYSRFNSSTLKCIDYLSYLKEMKLEDEGFINSTKLIYTNKTYSVSCNFTEYIQDLNAGPNPTNLSEVKFEYRYTLNDQCIILWRDRISYSLSVHKFVHKTY